MPIGVGAALLIGSAVSAGTQVAGAAIQKSAANKARDQQQAATNRAQQVNQQAMQPYMDAGQRGLQQLQNPAFSQPYTQVFGGPGGSNGAQAFGGPMTQMPPGGPQAPPPGSLGAMGGGQGMQGPMMPPAQQMAQGGAAGAMVNLRAPDGSVRPFPADQVPAIIQRAAAKGFQLQRV